MISLLYKPDFAQAAQRFEAWWRGKLLDRPPVSVWIKADRSQPPLAEPPYASLRDRWFDAEYRVAQYVHQLPALPGSDCPAETLPIYWANMGPEITATLYGCELDFSEGSSWSKPVVHELDDWRRILDTPPNFDNPYWQAMERMTDLALRQGRGRFLVGLTDLHGNYDILAALRDPQLLCMDILDDPALIQRVGAHVARGFVEALNRGYAQVSAGGQGSTCWTPMYHQGLAYVPSCDFWCMVSDSVAREMILPDILTEMAPMQRSIFHLDGIGALRFLDLLLAIPSLNAVQWVYGAGHGPAARWIDVYRRIRAAGKNVQVNAADAADALAVLDAVGPEGLWLCVDKHFASAQEAETFVGEVARRTGRV
jgi:hypothetical protein